ncbi:MAG: FAD-dependent oxidoreductase [Propionibacteriaceae bacterium]|jgi:dihydrolipoamide dehydrogenase|nr:FAD-dependent oxidoreductase [Propionibacteriaceae bacterium]
MTDYDVIVIGGGPGGYLAAERLGQAGRRTLLAEEGRLGGVCLNLGCIPTKSLLYSAKLYRQALGSAEHGVTASQVTFDWQRVQAWKAATVERLVAGVTRSERRAGVTVAQAHANLVSPGVVEVDGARRTAQHIIIATGSTPVVPPIPGASHNPAVLDSSGLLAIDHVPDKLVVIGGGVIGVELAALFAAFGSAVEVIEAQPEIVPLMDADMAARLRQALPQVGFNLNATVQAIEGNVVVYRDAAGVSQRCQGEAILMAVGRRPLVDGWGAAAAGLEHSRRGVAVGWDMRTNLPNVWAVGDVTGRSALAHAAYRMAEVAVAHILDPAAARARGQRLRLETIPWAVYSTPEAAGVGLTEAAAREAGLEVATATVPLTLSGRFLAENGPQAPGAAKIVLERASRVVRGLHLLGPYAPETIWGAAAALEAELTVDDLRQVVFPHPTVAEAIREAAWAVPD